MIDEPLFIHLYLDHDVNPQLAIDLRVRGFDAVATREVGNQSLPDDEQLAYASSQGRTLLTHNIADYARLHKRYIDEGRVHAGILVSRQFSTRAYGELLRRTLEFLHQVTAEEIRNQLRFLEEFRLSG